ncbi:MAG: helix-turn-helix domain-containing protein, partial [Oscillospiraceae bacterium]|nr:helix-turn-helix domain-containing protein [Oscillospiraceae bacterium]
PESELIDREGLRELMTALQTILTNTEKAVLELYLDGFSYQEIAERIGKPRKSVDNAVQRIRRKATQILGESGFPV